MVSFRSARSSKAPLVEGFRAACIAGQAADGGLLVPDTIPTFDPRGLQESDLPTRAATALAPWFTGELPPADLERLCRRIFDFPVPLVRLDPETLLLELFHGPTASFKDFGARFLAQVMAALREPGEPLTVIVATSGDTGAAVAQAFSGIADARVVLLYPRNRVSPLQELQLTAVPENVVAVRVDGTFDDCQTMVRSALADAALVRQLGLVPANSIHIARLLPQIVYYVHAAIELAGDDAEPGSRSRMPGKHRATPPAAPHPTVVVPSGNLGNLTAGLWAKWMGAPLGRFLAAVNRNDAFERYVATGRFDPPPVAHATPSNAMDVGNPSNFERIRALYGGDVGALRQDVAALSIDDESTLASIQRTYEESGRFVCPHTAVGLAALRMARWQGKDRDIVPERTPAIVLGTAHPGKFASIVERATGHAPPIPPAWAALERSRRAPRDLRTDPAAFAAVLRRLQ